MRMKLAMIRFRQDATASGPIEIPQNGPCGPTLYYDGSCPLCTREIAFYASRIGGTNLKLVDVSQGDGDTVHDLALEEAMRRFHVRRHDGVLISGADAFVEIWRALPNWSWLAKVASLPGTLAALELLYRGFLWIRPAISMALSKLGVSTAKPRSGTGVAPNR
jgi:predicted DCC family thiol-disulfide oxidoreductase YuxK